MITDTLQLLNPVIDITVHFGGQALLVGSSDFEVSLLQEIQANGSGLVLHRADGLFRNREYHTIERAPIYKLSCPARGMELTFTLDKWRGMSAAVVLMLVTAPHRQGNFYSLKGFLLNCVAKSLFASGIAAIVGDAERNERPVRNKPDFRREKTRDGTPKLVKIYEYLGFKRTAGNNMVLVKNDFVLH